MIVLHFITMLVYLISVITYYIFFAEWDGDDDNKREENKVFCTWAICQILLTLVEFVLICLFWGVSKKIDPRNDTQS